MHKACALQSCLQISPLSLNLLFVKYISYPSCYTKYFSRRTTQVWSPCQYKKGNSFNAITSRANRHETRHLQPHTQALSRIQELPFKVICVGGRPHFILLAHGTFRIQASANAAYHRYLGTNWSNPSSV